MAKHLLGRESALVLGLALLGTACTAQVDENLESVEAPLTNSGLDENGIKTAYGAQVAIGAGTDHVLSVWVSSANAQVVGQPFATSASDGTGGGTPYGGKAHPLLTAFSNTTRAKSFPAMAWDHNQNRFLVVWQDDYSSTDSDIWGAIVDDKGDLVPLTSNTNPFIINYDGDKETMPTVSFIRQQDAGFFLVSYVRKVSAENRTALSSQWVGSDGGVGGLFDTVSTGVSQTASRPTSAYIASAVEHRILFTWNENKYGFGFMDSPVVDTVNTISNATAIVGAANATPGGVSYGLAWHMGDKATAKVQARVFPENCYAPSCANSVVDALTSSGSVTNLHNPVISAAFKGFGVFAGTEEPTWHIAYKEISPSSGSSGSVTPSCGGALQSVSGKSLGSNGGLIAAVTPPNVLAEPKIRQYLMYDSYCGTPAASAAKEMVAGVNPAAPSDVLSFNVSTNGN